MLHHFFISFHRNFKKNLSHNLINMAGLVAGITSFLYLYIYCRDELSFDQFHKDHNRIYKVVDTYTFSDQPVNSATVSAPMGPALVSNFPEVEMAVRINKVNGLVRPVKSEENEFQFERILFADSGFFKLFSFELLQGNSSHILTEPNTVILSESAATKLFGESDPMGQLLKTNLLGGQTMVVTGIMKDPPTNSHIQYDILVSHVSMVNVVTTLNNWLVYGTHTYILLKPGTSPVNLSLKFKTLVKQNIGDEMASKYNHQVVPIESVHLGISRRSDLEPSGSLVVIYIFTIVGVLLLFLVTANFISLSISIASARLKESGVRKFLGSSKAQLISQFMMESCIISLSASLISLTLVLLLLNSFNFLSGKEFSVDQVFSAEILAGTVVIGFMIGIISGLFPSQFLVRLDPVHSLKKISSPGIYGGQRLMNILVVSQFSVVIALLISAAIIRQQLEYFRNHDIGFKKSGAIIIPINSPVVGKNRIAMIEEFRSLSGITDVTTSSSTPSKNLSFGPFRLEGGSFDDNAILNVMTVDASYIKTMELRLIAGRSFDRNLASDSVAFILNETAVQSLGIAGVESTLGKYLELHGTNKDAPAIKSGPIVGVIKNFHFKSLKEEVEPLVMHIGKGGYGYFTVRVNTSELTSTIDQLKKKWVEVEPGQSMVYSFLDDDLDKLYKSEKRLGDIFNVFNYLTIIIGCIGLFGLSSYVMLRKGKEISLRKVLGATTGQIMLRFSFNFIKLVLISFIIACPMAYFAAERWLEGFAYHESIDVMNFVIAGAFALVITSGTIAYHITVASQSSPIRNLRSE